MRVSDPVAVVDSPAILINEFFGNVASGDKSLSACVVKVNRASEEAYQRPEFSEYVIVTEGSVTLLVGEEGDAPQKLSVSAGQGAFLPRGTRVKWVWNGPCSYVPICTPAFSPANCGREEEAGNHLAKSSEAMKELRALHEKANVNADAAAAEQARHPYLYHVARVDRWETAKSEGGTYLPPTFEADGGFTHMTADPSKLIDVLNHFYKGVPGEWVCLRTTAAALGSNASTAGALRFEHTSPVGDTPAIDMGDQLFPHLYAGIPAGAGAGVVLEEAAVSRAPDGTFLSIPGVTATNAPRAASETGVFFDGFIIGALAGALAAVAFSKIHSSSS